MGAVGRKGTSSETVSPAVSGLRWERGPLGCDCNIGFQKSKSQEWLKFLMYLDRNESFKNLWNTRMGNLIYLVFLNIACLQCAVAGK